MKKITRFALLSLLVLSLFVLSGCSAFIPQNQPKITKSYPKETAPSQVIRTENQWVMLHNTYGSQSYTISVGESLDSAKNVYSVKNVSIWYFEADESCVAWCEKSSDFYTYKVFDFETQEVISIFKITTDSEYQPQNVGVYMGDVYYCTINYDTQQVQVNAYDIATKSTTEIIKAALENSYQPYSINVENDYLTFSCSGKITVLALQNGEPVFDSILPDGIKRVFAASYDSKNETAAIYYSDNDGEHIGILKEGEGDISSVFTFNKNHYAYQDKIACYDGHLYWVTQANVSGNISDHYKFVDYNYLEHTVTETDKAFDFCYDENDFYILRFNKRGNYTHINLCQY